MKRIRPGRADSCSEKGYAGKKSNDTNSVPDFHDAQTRIKGRSRLQKPERSMIRVMRHEYAQLWKLVYGPPMDPAVRWPSCARHAAAGQKAL
jgi:hypothetical protein